MLNEYMTSYISIFGIGQIQKDDVHMKIPRRHNTPNYVVFIHHVIMSLDRIIVT